MITLWPIFRPTMQKLLNIKKILKENLVKSKLIFLGKLGYVLDIV
jgi:hypothetical protein